MAPITGPRAAWGRLLQNAIARAVPPDTAQTVRWIVHDEVATGPPPVGILDGQHAAVFGHLAQEGLSSALPLYAEAELPCFLPFTHPEDPPRVDLVLSWSSSIETQVALLVKLLSSVRARSVLLLRDSSPYGIRLAELLAEAVPGKAEVRDAEEPQPRPALDAVVLCTLYHRATQVATALQDDGYRGHLIFPGDCAIGEFFGRRSLFHGSHLVRPAEGAAARAELAVRALLKAAAVLPAGSTGREWVAAVREASSVPLDLRGQPVADSWQLVRLDETQP